MESLCWTCGTGTGNCEWLDRLKPVTGAWTLMKEVHEYDAKDGRAIYLVYIQCPKYSNGERRLDVPEIAYMKDGCFYGKDNQIIRDPSINRHTEWSQKRYDATLALFDLNREWTIAELAEEMECTGSTISAYLRKARKAGLIEKGKKLKKQTVSEKGRKGAIWLQYYRKVKEE